MRERGPARSDDEGEKATENSIGVTLNGERDILGLWAADGGEGCIVHLVRNTPYGRRPGNTGPKCPGTSARSTQHPREAAANERFVEFSSKWGKRYPAIIRLWENAWSEFVPFLDYDVEIRRVICSTNAVESLKARYRGAVRARVHFPTEQAALKCLCLATRALDPTGIGSARWATRWKPALNAFAISFDGRIN
ncbi:transposase [Pseudarthrobacter quantipunctorum]|uniref:Mutator family transposase n=1 Tax=Pseudarthrobacter quantipunctorum TaxID=3128980 RepID=A0ABZ2QZX9_9MICC